MPTTRTWIFAIVVAAACTHPRATTQPAARAGDAPPPSAAKLTDAEARTIALANTPGEVKASELEREHGHLIYSIEIIPTGADHGIKEVNVDAIDGSIVGVEDEDDDDHDGDVDEGHGDHRDTDDVDDLDRD
ncbi:MAG: PepSY domain-containing protein [Kofleriaceae bacterium]